MPYCTHCGTEVHASAAVCPRCGQPPFAPPTPGRRDPAKLVLLVVLLAVLAAGAMVLAIVAAIAIPNLLSSMERAKVHRTLADLRAIGSAVEAYRAEHGAATPGGSIAELAAGLEPSYMTHVPRVDAWQHPYRYSCWREKPGSGGCDHYRLISAGHDGIFEHQDARLYAPRQTEPGDRDRDLVFGDGLCIQCPRGMQ
jgi:general secretion pathway protein G